MMTRTYFWIVVLKPYLLFLLKSNQCQATPRSNVIIQGMTVGPNYFRREGNIAWQCPDSHPWAFNNGTLCCVNFHQSGGIARDLGWYDAENLCPDGNYISCPSLHFQNALCKTNPAFKIPQSCPTDHPIQMENACCWSYRRKMDANCDGGLIDKDDPALCCPDEKLFQPPDCQQFKRKCISLSPENVRTYCPLQPQTRRFSVEDFSYISHLRTNIIFKNVQNYCGPHGGQTMPITNGSLNDALKFLRDPELGIPPQVVRTYVVGAVKVLAKAQCKSKNSCVGKIRNRSNVAPMNFSDGFADQVNVFQVSSSGGWGIALDIRLDPLYIKLKNINIGTDSGSFLCQIKCLD